ncbi:MAG: response regulator transcription factor [Kineosporiaceae bacterium]
MTVLIDRARLPQTRGRFTAAVVSPNPHLRETLARTLRALGAAEVEGMSHAAQARRIGRGRPGSVVVVEAQLPDGSGIGLVQELRALGWTRSVVLSTNADPFAVRGAVAAGVRCYVVTSRAAAAAQDPQARATLDQLSAREIEVLQLVADGRSNKDVGEALGLSALTVKSHLARIARKLGTGDRAEMVAMALRGELIR